MNERKISFNYSVNLIDILKQLKRTIVISTYQTGKIIMISEKDGDLEIKYINLPRPMGMYGNGVKLWAGLGHSIWEFHNFDKIKKYSKNDACYLPLNIHYTGDIDIHEMEAYENKLYFINTKFSCLCEYDPTCSFKPIWKPKFITDLQPTDKCHLNGLCIKDGEPRYVTTLGSSDEPLGWRKNKAKGGLLIDIKTDKVLAKGLSMPHSPRWHQEKLWFLESGKGTLSYINLKSKRITKVIEVPGFTRGLHFLGNLAFIGVSKVRESATFSGLPITKLPKRVCGVWLVDTASKKIISFFEFTEGVDEIFSVSVLPHAHVDIYDANNEYSHVNYLINPEYADMVKMPQTEIELAAPHFDKGNELYNMNKKEEAIEEFKKALKIQPDFLPATFNIAISLGDLGRFEEAEKILMDVIEKDASIAEAYNSLGYVYYKMGDYKRAKENFEKALELNPKYEQPKNALIVLEKELKEKQEEKESNKDTKN
ncbi:TIGR03032 family protein [Nautilia sp. PV-1]|uniref:TIGR03032 family protein n=1 Tax=Nautilia sp. PV-1 TaxID=2579250 RepID=UPI000FD9DABB|nr:TIGR03032 family protein [Nautilia sp. PV-1]AZV47085.1 TIGR03032 family protein [Nautilia sp. PV-1]